LAYLQEISNTYRIISAGGSINIMAFGKGTGLELELEDWSNETAA
jgi:hypothetical protein